MTTFSQMALRLRGDGYEPIPIRPGTKVPAVSRWQHAPNAKVLSRWLKHHADCGIGLVCGRIVAVDLDVTVFEAAQRLADLTTALLGPTPLVRVGRAPKTLLVYRVAETMQTLRQSLSVGKIELLAAHTQFVAYGVHPDTNQPYQWIGESSPEFTPADRIPVVTPLQLEDLLHQSLKLFPASQKNDAGEPRPRSTQPGCAALSPIIRCPRSNMVVDGRDWHLACLVRDAWRENEYATAHQIAGLAWDQFQATADLARPARDGKRSWCALDAFRKAKALLRKERAGTIRRIAKSRGRLAPDGLADLSAEDCERFRTHVEALHRRGRLSRPAWLVSEFMLARLRGGRTVDSVQFIGKHLDLPGQTVRRARRALLQKGLWETARQLGHREMTAPYFPATEKLVKLLAEQVLSAGGVSEVIPKNQRGLGGEGAGEALGSAATPAERVELVSPEIPPQPHDAIQLSLLPPACDESQLRIALANWNSGPVPDLVKAAYTDKKLRRALREIDISAAVEISREHVSNSRFETFGLSPAATARIKNWLLPDDFPIPPDLIPAGDRHRPPHHRRGGKKRPEPMPAFPVLRLFRVHERQGPRADLFQAPDRDERESDQHRVSRIFG